MRIIVVVDDCVDKFPEWIASYNNEQSHLVWSHDTDLIYKNILRRGDMEETTASKPQMVGMEYVDFMNGLARLIMTRDSPNTNAKDAMSQTLHLLDFEFVRSGSNLLIELWRSKGNGKHVVAWFESDRGNSIEVTKPEDMDACWIGFDNQQLEWDL